MDGRWPAHQPQRMAMSLEKLSLFVAAYRDERWSTTSVMTKMY
jgi:hypothetical protein